MTPTATSALRWRLQDLDLSAVDADSIRQQNHVFLLVCSASFIESGSDTYTRNLVKFFAEDSEVAGWLQDHWEPEELQHGRALRAYIAQVWPEFDWEGAYADFFAEYAPLCTTEELEPTRGQELAARCIVEMGTTTYYQALGALCHEPVLQNLTQLIRNDEVQHYKHFYRYFLTYRNREAIGRAHVLAALWRRVAELRNSDADIALRHAGAWRWRGHDNPPDLTTLRSEVFALMRAHYPVELAVRMITKPLQLGPRLQRMAQGPLSAAARHLLLS